jgi:hypothetical protein
MTDKFDPSSSINSAAKAVAWVTAFIAPIKIAYSYISGGNLSGEGVATKLGIWTILWNMSINFGYCMLFFFIFLYIATYVLAIPIGLVVAFFYRNDDDKKMEPAMNRLMYVIYILVGLAILPFLLGGMLSALDPQTNSLLDDLLGVVGAIYLFCAYFYVYLAATGQWSKKSEENAV